MNGVICSDGLNLVRARHKFMYFVYVLQDKNGNLYKGFTNNLAKRFRDHKSKNGCRTTSMMNDLKIVYSEEFESQKDARAREVYLKTSAGRRFLKSNLRS